MNSYNLAEHLIVDWLEWDVDDLKTDIRREVTDWLENYVTSNPELEELILRTAEQDWCDESEARSSIEDWVNDWLDEHLFK